MLTLLIEWVMSTSPSLSWISPMGKIIIDDFNLIYKFKIVPIFLWMVAFSIIIIILFCRWTYFFIFWCIFGRNTQKHFVSFNSYLQIFILEPSFAHDFWLNGAVSLLNELLFALVVDISSRYLQKTLSQKKNQCGDNLNNYFK